MNNDEKILAILEKHSGLFEQVFSRMDRMQKVQDRMQKAQETMQSDLTAIKVRLDYDVEKRFEAVNEGIDAILERLTPKSRVDALEADVTVLKTAVKMLTQEVGELKQAQ